MKKISLLEFKDYINSDGVKSIKMRETPCALGGVFTIICEKDDTMTCNKEYTLIVR